jgi:methyltransferase (TIGR00027 family)
MTAPETQVSPDGLVALRLTSPLVGKLGIVRSYDRLFATPGGRALAQLAREIDPAHEQCNLVCYRWLGERMEEAAGRVPQMLILGAGYDTRSLTLPALTRGACMIFEVDAPQRLAVKRAVLSRNGIELPPHVRFVPTDVASQHLLATLKEAGYDPRKPVAVFMGGVFFYLTLEAAVAVIDPRGLELRSGSTRAFDYWSDKRLDSLNRQIASRIGRKLFGASPLGDSPKEAGTYCRNAGYGDVKVTKVAALSASFGVPDIGETSEGWMVLEATVA